MTKNVEKANKQINIFTSDKNMDVWKADSWDDYEVNYGLFVVKLNGEWVGIYPLSSIYKVTVK